MKHILSYNSWNLIYEELNPNTYKNAGIKLLDKGYQDRGEKLIKYALVKAYDKLDLSSCPVINGELRIDSDSLYGEFYVKLNLISDEAAYKGYSISFIPTTEKGIHDLYDMTQDYRKTQSLFMLKYGDELHMHNMTTNDSDDYICEVILDEENAKIVYDYIKGEDESFDSVRIEDKIMAVLLGIDFTYEELDPETYRRDIILDGSNATKLAEYFISKNENLTTFETAIIRQLQKPSDINDNRSILEL